MRIRTNKKANKGVKKEALNIGKMSLVVGDFNLSSWSMRAWLAAQISGLEINTIAIRLDTPKTETQIKKYSPSGKVPVLVHDKLSIWDSLAICEYLAEVSPNKAMWPRSRSARAEARAYVSEMHSGFGSLRSQLSMDVNLRIKINHLTPGTVADIQRICGLWERALKKYKGPFLFGEFSLVDIYFAPVVSRFVSYGIEIKSKAIKKYMQNILAQEVVQDWFAKAKKEKAIRPPPFN